MPRRNRNTGTGRLKRRGKKLIEIVWEVERFGLIGLRSGGQTEGRRRSGGGSPAGRPAGAAPLGGADGSGRRAGLVP